VDLQELGVQKEDLKELGVQHKDIQIILTLQRLQNINGVTNQLEVGRNLGYSVKTVERRLRKLKELGWVKLVRTGSKTWNYIITGDCPFILCGGNEPEVPTAKQKPISGCFVLKMVGKRPKLVGGPSYLPGCPERIVMAELAGVREPSKLAICPEFPDTAGSTGGSEPSTRVSDPPAHIFNKKPYSNPEYYNYDVDMSYENISVENEKEFDIWGDPSTPSASSLQPSHSVQVLDEEKDMAEPKIVGSDTGALADLKKRLESGESYIQGKVRKGGFKASNPPDEFGKEEPAYPKKEQIRFCPPKSREELTKEKPKVEYNQIDLWFVFKRCWNDAKINGRPTIWTLRERKHVKDMIAEQGSEAIVTYFEYCFKNWNALVFNHHITSIVPSIPLLYGYRRSLLPEALNPTIRVNRQCSDWIEDPSFETGKWPVLPVDNSKWEGFETGKWPEALKGHPKQNKAVEETVRDPKWDVFMVGVIK